MTWTAEKNAELVRLFNQGYPVTYIATWVDAAPDEVADRLAQLGLSARRSGRPDAMPRARSLGDLWRAALAR